MIRIESIPSRDFASISSLIVLLNQSVLPAIGMIIYISGDSTGAIYLFMSLAVAVSFTAGLLLYRYVLPDTERSETTHIGQP